jgi:hypothetical protein
MTENDRDGGQPLTPAESAFVARLVQGERNDERISLVLGSGLGAGAVPRVAEVIALAERYAAGRGDQGDLRRALSQARRGHSDPSPAALYEAYRTVLTAWVSVDEFDAIAQQAVLQMYRPQDRLGSPLGTHGLWQRITLELGEQLEDDYESWQLSASMRALGAVLVRKSELFGNRVLTTNIDPLLEIAIRSAGGRAVSYLTNGDHGPHLEAGDDAIEVHHLHGFWRPLLPGPPGRLVDDVNASAAQRTGRSAAGLLNGDLICVLGAGDRPGTIKAAMRTVRRRVPVLWALHGSDVPAPAKPSRRNGVEIEYFVEVDSDRVLPELARQLAVPVPAGTTESGHQVRHPAWERLFVSQPDNVPPEDIAGLLRELERRFAWKVQWAEAEALHDTPTLLFWPIRLRRRTSVIHMAQAFAAGALAARGARLVISIDDFGIEDAAALQAPFEADLRRWIAHIAPDAEPEFSSLVKFIDQSQSSSAPENLLRPIDPWSVARDFYGRHNPSLYTVLAAVKALPNLAPYELDAEAGAIVQQLQQRTADRLLTPMTMWAFLHYLLLDSPSSSLMTLGGRDEGLFWEQWRQIYGFGISQLYNPRIKSLSHESGMVRWNSRRDLAQHLSQVRELPRWDGEGSYIPWLFQNAVLLPTYLTGHPVPKVDGLDIDSWAAFAAALDEGVPVLDMLADQATELYQGRPPA